MWNDKEIKAHVEFLDSIENAVLKAVDKGYRDRETIHEFVNWMLDGETDERYVDICINQQLSNANKFKLETL